MENFKKKEANILQKKKDYEYQYKTKIMILFELWLIVGTIIGIF